MDNSRAAAQTLAEEIEEDKRFFANREEEIKVVEKKVKEAQSAPVAYPVTEFYAVMGQGKTWLLRHIFLYFRRDESTLTKHTVTARVNFDTLAGTTWYHQFANLLSVLANGLFNQTNQKIELESIPKDRAPSPRELEKRSKSFVEQVQELTGQFVPILIFDATEHADEDLFDWLEENILYPLVSRQRVLFVFGSRRRLFWKLFDVRRRVNSISLDAFEENDCDEQLSKRQVGEEVGKLLFSYSAGHPETNWRIVEALRERQQSAQINQEVIETNQVLISETVHEMIEKRFTVDLKPETQKLVWDICVLRKFHVESMRYMAQHRDVAYAEKVEGDFLDAIRDMRDNALVVWDADRKGYMLDATVRQIMLKNLEMREPMDFRVKQQRAVNLYADWMKQFPQNVVDYFVEWLYHEAILLGLRQTKLEEIMKGLNEVLGIRDIGLEQLLERFDKDQDLSGKPGPLHDAVRARIKAEVNNRGVLIPAD